MSTGWRKSIAADPRPPSDRSVCCIGVSRADTSRSQTLRSARNTPMGDGARRSADGNAASRTVRRHRDRRRAGRTRRRPPPRRPKVNASPSIEQDKVGGTCLNRGCRPTKALRASARVAHLARTAAAHGVTTGDVSVDFAAVMARKDRLIDGWVDSSTEVVGGHRRARPSSTARPASPGPRTAATSSPSADRTLAAPKVFLNVGTRAAEPPIPGLADVPWLDNDRILHLDPLPEHLVVVGGGYIALELGQMFRRFGSAVTILERGQHDRRAGGRRHRRRDHPLPRRRRSDDPHAVERRSGRGERRRRPRAHGRPGRSTGPICSSPSGAHRTPICSTSTRSGWSADEHGIIATDGTFHTAVDGIWALGDINGRGAFTHTSYQDCRDPHRQPGRRDAGPPTVGSRRTRCSPTRRSAASA